MYSTQLISESVWGKHNITEWVKQEISTIAQSDIDMALMRAELFLTQHFENLEQKARVEEITLIHTLEEAKQILVDSLLSAIIMITPDIRVRGGKEIAFPGASPIQAVATQIGLSLCEDQVSAVQTGIEILAFFSDMGIYDVRIVKEADRSVNKGGHTTVHGDSAVVIPTLQVSLDLYLRIKATKYLPPMLVKPLDYI